MTRAFPAFVLCVLFALAAAPSWATAQEKLSYHADVLPLFRKHCLDCHGGDKADGEYRVDSYLSLIDGGESGDTAVVPGKPEEGVLLKYLTGALSPRMPKKRKALSSEEIERVRNWIEQGAIEGEPEPVFSDDQIAFFETSIRPLLAKHCIECHGSEKARGNLAFTSRKDLLLGGTKGPAIVPGKPAASLLIQAVRHTGDLRMPRNKPQLGEEDISLLEKWISQQAPWPASEKVDPPKVRKRFVIYESDRTHWAFQPVVKPETPKVKDTAWPRNAIDRFIMARMEAAGVPPAAQASRRALMRRLSFDLTGLPPAPEDFDKHLNNSQQDPSLAQYVDQLIGSEEFGVRWARHWLDQVRYRPDRGKSEQNDPYRLWVIRALNRDLPYSDFLKMQIAGDLLLAKNSEEVHLDGHIAVRPWSLKSRHHEQIDLLGRTFLGVSLYCARCHDHKHEPLSRNDYFAIKGIFESSRVIQIPLLEKKPEFDAFVTGLERVEHNETRMKKELKKFSRVAALVDLQQRLASEREKLKGSPGDAAKIQKNIDKLLKDEEKRLAEIKKQGLKLDDPGAVEYMRLRKENNTFTATWKHVDQIEALADQSDADKIGDAIPLEPGQQNEGDDKQAVPRRFPVILAGAGQTPLGERTSQSGRLELADWLASPQHPVTARLLVNRVWYYLLGEGLTPSLSNFGRSGQPPTHPLLLDYLSAEFVSHNWSLKQLIRQIVLSSTYQQTSRLEVAPGEHAQRTKLFAVARRRRLEVESIYRTMEWLERDPASPGKQRPAPVDVVSEMRLLFDGANSNLIVPRRASSISPLQALFLMNSNHMKESTARFAARIHRLPEANRIPQAFLLLYGREATDAEVATGNEFLAAWEPQVVAEPPKNKTGPASEDVSRWQAYLQVLLLSNEFLYVD